LELGIATYTPLEGSNYLKLSKQLEEEKAIVNIQNDDERCFLWSIVGSLHPVHWKDQPQQV